MSYPDIRGSIHAGSGLLGVVGTAVKAMVRSCDAANSPESVVNAIQFMNIADIAAYPRKGLWTERAARDRLGASDDHRMSLRSAADSISLVLFL